MLNRLTGAIDFQGQALVLRAERQRLIAGNIANADTPGFQARDFDFAAALRQAAGSGAGNALGDPVFDAGPASTSTMPTANLKYAAASQTSLDSNSVDMDRERAAFADNALKYESTLRFINAQVRTLGDAMRSPNQG